MHIVGDVAPTADETLPATMSFQQVHGFFNALGHALQELLTDQREGLAAGCNGMELDAAKFPRKFFGLWAYDPAVLRSIGKHFHTGETLPDSAIDSIVGMQSLHIGSRLSEEVRAARIDLELHFRFDPERGESPDHIVQRIYHETVTGQPHEEEEAVLLSSVAGHVVNGYAAGYYSDLWAEVLAADAFELFHESGISDEITVERLGRHFHNTILRPGAGAHPLKAFQEFRNRNPRIEPFLRRCGLQRGNSPTDGKEFQKLD